MPDRDFAVGTVGIPQVGKVSTKPRYLIQLYYSKTVKLVNFIALDKPTFEADFISVKGFYCEETEDNIVAEFNDLVENTSKDQIQEIMIPNHRVHVIRSLVFNANKPATLPNR